MRAAGRALAVAASLVPGLALGAGFGPETNLSVSPVDSETGLSHRALAWDRSGGLHAAWCERDSPGSQYRIWTSRFTGTWSAPVLTVDYLASDPGDLGDDLGAKFPALAVTADGEVHVFWHDYRIGGIDNAEIFTKTRSVNGWDPSQAADVRLTTTAHPESNGDNGYVPVPVATATGDLHVAWYDFRYDGQNAEILAKARPAGGTFDLTPGDGADDRVTNDAAHSELVDLAADDLGHVYAVWRHVDGGATIRFARRDAGTGAWSAPAVVSTQATVAGAPAIAVDGGGTVHVVWPDGRDGGRALFTRTRTAGGVWSAESRLTRPSDGADEPALTADPATGSLHLVWSDGRVSLLNREVFHREKTSAAAWDTTYAADDRISNASGASTRPSVAVSGGQVAVLWKDSRTGQNDIWVRLRPVEAVDVPAPNAPARLAVSPNPARGPVRVLVPTGDAVRVFDVSGRTIARVPIAGQIGVWDLRDGSARRVPTGVYFLRTADGTSARVTVLR
ncbi:MAG: hypothetical protein R3B81_17720 [bacterium]